MNRVTKRTWLMTTFVLVLLGGMLFFLGEYIVKSPEWIVFQGSPHLYNNTNIGFGTITDRTGETLLDMSADRTYSQNVYTRKSTLHWLGDRNGAISASAISSHAAHMAGFDRINGIYDTSGEGGSTRLTLSAYVQNTAMEAMGGRKGTVAVYNYQTGEILCALTAPNYDPDNVPDIEGDTTGAYAGAYVNRFIQSAYVPGSIFKIVTVAAALEHVPGIEDMTFTCQGKIEYGTEAVTCESVHGTQDLKRAFANSCNCAFAQVSELIGKKNMTDTVRKFGITDSIRVDGAATAKGNYDVSDAAPVSFAWSCIGQYNDLVNPAQYMSLMGAIGGGGEGAMPHIVASVESGGKTTYQAKTEKSGRLLSQEVAQTLGSYMRNNASLVYGDWNFNGLNVCAKSGTSELGGGQTSNAMFAGFVQDESYPLAFVVVVENGGYGASTCVPILSRVLTACKTVMDNER